MLTPHQARPLINSLELHSDTFPTALHLWYGSALSGAPYVKGETQEIKGFLLKALFICSFGERHKSCLLFVELQSILPKTFYKSI